MKEWRQPFSDATRFLSAVRGQKDAGQKDGRTKKMQDETVSSSVKVLALENSVFFQILCQRV